MFGNYLKIALRNLRRHLGFATLSTLGLGLSIACCVLIFLLVRHHTSFDRFHAKAGRTVMISTETKGEVASREGNVPYPMGAALRQEYAFLEKTAMVAARHTTQITLEKPGEAPVKFKEEGIRAFADPDFFEIFDFPLSQGSLESFRQPNTAFITEQLARKYYGNTDALGKTFKTNNNTDYQVVGVLRDIPGNTDLPYQMYCSWATLTADTNARGMLHNWGGINGGVQCFAVLREGHATQELENAFTTFREKYFHPEVREWYYHAVPLVAVHFDTEVGSGIRESYIWALSLIGLFLLLTACVNFVNMATAQALNRAREVGVRKSLGSTRAQLFWQFMSETGLIVLFSTATGMAAAWLALPALNSLINTKLSFPLSDGATFYGFLATLMLVVAFLSGAYPGLALSAFRPVESLKGSGEGSSAGRGRLRKVLVGTQFAISQALIIGAITITAQMEYTRTADVGFKKDGIVLLPVKGRFDLGKQNLLRNELAAVPGVESISLCFQPPASDANWTTRIRLEGRSEPENWETNIKPQDSRYLETFGIPLVAGRNLEPSDTTREILVNEEMVRKLGLAHPADILGKTLYEGRNHFPVVGVVRDFHNRSFREPIRPQVLTSEASDFDVCAVRINMQNQQAILAAVGKIWTDIFPEYYYEYEFLDAQIAKFYESESVMMQLMRLFAGIAVFIGCLGLYGLSAFMVTRRRKEIGIRKTLGASVAGVLWLFGKEYARLLLFAFLVAAPFAWWAMDQWLENYAYRIHVGAGILAISLLLTLIIATVTVGFQSGKAALANPVKSLRSE